MGQADALLLVSAPDNPLHLRLDSPHCQPVAVYQQRGIAGLADRGENEVREFVTVDRHRHYHAAVVQHPSDRLHGNLHASVPHI